MSALLDALWATHTANAPPPTDDPNLDFNDGQRVQLALLERWLNSGEQLGGWKIGMTSGANRNGLGDGIRPFGFLLQSRVLTSGATLEAKALGRGQVENELCFLMGADLGPGATEESAKAAVAAALPAFEINQKRLPPDSGAGLRVADNLSNWGIVIGEPVQNIPDLTDLEVTLSNQDEEIERVASAGHIDDHYASLAILANRLADFGQTLSAGQYVITGAYGKASFAPGSYRGEFEPGIGSVQVQLT